MDTRTTPSHPHHRARRTAAALLVAPTTAAALIAALTAPADAAPGQVSVQASVPTPNADGWFGHGTSVGLEVSASDGVESGQWKVTNGGQVVAQGGLDEGSFSVPVSQEGVNHVSWSVVGPGGRRAGGSADLSVDLSDPALTVGSPADGSTFREGSDPSLVFSCTDAVSGVAHCSDGAGLPSGGTLDTSTPGPHEIRLVARDRAGRETVRLVHYRVQGLDRTAPDVTGEVHSGQAGENGWYVSPAVLFRASAVDPEVADHATSGVHHVDTELDGVQQPSSSMSPADVNVTGEGVHTLRYAAADRADNASEVESATIRIDSVDPEATVTYPTAGAVLSADSSDEARLGCADETSGVVRCRTLIDGQHVYEDGEATLDLTPGTHWIQMSAYDAAGNIGREELSYFVPGAEKRSTTRLTKVDVHRRSAGSATVVVRAKGGAEGTVRLLDGRRRLAVAPVTYVPDSDKGVARMELPALSRGVHRLRAVYGGSLMTEPSRSRVVRVRVR